MIEQIFEYELKFPKTVLMMPKGAEIVAIQLDDNMPQGCNDDDEPQCLLWARQNPEEELVLRSIIAVGSDKTFDMGSATYITTIQHCGFAWHYFDDDENTWEGNQ